MVNFVIDGLHPRWFSGVDLHSHVENNVAQARPSIVPIALAIVMGLRN